MGKAENTKKKIMQVTKELILEKGYAAVTMNDVNVRTGISTGGLYYHYHSVEAILLDIIKKETGDVWQGLKDNNELYDLLKSIEKYFEGEKKEMLDFTNTLSAILYEYYFSHPYSSRQNILKTDYKETFNKMYGLLSPFISDEKERTNLCNHIFVTLHGLNFLAMSGEITEECIDYEFDSILSKIFELSNRKRVR
ncbi:MAG: TetR/AcrR family transcriptional regulator [Lachnospiraceae bacterium]